jgi:hypothetical protein
MNLFTKFRGPILVLLSLLFSLSQALAQGKLDKRISITAHQKSLAQTLTEIGRKGDFYFSYNTNIIKGDSLVSLNESNGTVRQILDKLLDGNYEYTESGRYIILLARTVVQQQVRIYTVSGVVKDEITKEKVSNVTIYESDQLVSALTDTNGYFKLRLKEKYAHATLIISKQLYRDTMMYISSGHDQQYTIDISRATISELSPFVVTNRVEKSWLGKFFLSSRQIVQSMNLAGFFADKPIQFSLTPGLGTHGHMGAQVINKFSLNLVGGYTAGVDGLEMAGVFNIDKKDVQYVQAAGVFNVAGGVVRGVQLAGIHNNDLDSVYGVQAAGVSNVVRRGFSGIQLSGLFNHVDEGMKGVQAGGIYNRDMDSLRGVQLAGMFNHVEKDMHGIQAAGLINRVKGQTGGMQLAGISNIAAEEMKGVQVSSIFNYTKRLSGLQIGLVNMADTSSGYMIGLVNIVRKGIHQLTVSSNEILPINLSYKMGNKKMYSIFLMGYSPGTNEKAYAYGFGIGNESRLSKVFSLTTELFTEQFYVGDWENTAAVYRIQPALQLRVSKKVSIFAGPAFSVYFPEAKMKTTAGYKSMFPQAGYHTFPVGGGYGWIGWNVGINFF